MKLSKLNKIASVFLAIAIVFGTLNVSARKPNSAPNINLGFSSPTTPSEELDNDTDISEPNHFLSPGISGIEKIAPFADLSNSQFNITDVSMTIDGEDVGINTAISPQSEITLKYKWSIPNGVVIANGDTFDFTVPDSFKASTDIEFDIDYTGSTGTIAHLFLSTSGLGTVTFDFNDDFGTLLDRNGEFEFNIKFSDHVINGPGRQEIQLGFSKNENIQLENNSVEESISKEGKIDPEFNSRNIDWIIDFNQDYFTIESPVFTDPLPDGLELVSSELVSYDIMLNGQEGPEQPSSYTVDYNTTTRLITIDFNGETIDSPYRLKIKTHIMDSAATDDSFENIAYLNGKNADGGDALEEITGGASVNNDAQMGKDLQKSGHYDPVEEVITWEVRFNYGKVLSVPHIHDYLSVEGGENLLENWFFVADSFKVEKVTPLSNTSETILSVEDFAMEPVGLSGEPFQEFNLSIGDTDYTEDPTATTDSYLITYQVKAKNIALIDTGKITNFVVNKEGHEENGVIPLQPHKPGASFTKTSKLDPQTKLVDWKITFNHGPFNMSLFNAKVIDKIPKGFGIMQVIEDTVVVERHSDPYDRNSPLEVISDDMYTLTLIDDAENFGFEVDFAQASNSPLTGPHYISFKTPYDFYQATPPFPEKYHNKVDLEYSGDIHDTEKNFDYPVSYDISNNGSKSGKYSAKDRTIHWNNNINFNNYDLENVKITDTLSVGQELVPNTLKIYTLKYNGSTASKDQDVTSTLAITESKTGFTINFGTITSGYVIEYDSAPKGLVVENGEYSNSAAMEATFDGKDYGKTWPAKVTIKKHDSFVEKSGAQDGNIVNWNVVINPNQSEIIDATLKDQLSPKQAYKRDTFVLYNGTYDENGNTLTKGSVVPSSEYTLQFHGVTPTKGEGFTLVFKNKINRAYILEYKHQIVKSSDEEILTEVSNSITIGGGLEDIGGAVTTVPVETSSGSGSGGGWKPPVYGVSVGGIVWIDLDGNGIRDDHDPRLPGVFIILTDKNGNPVYDINGELVKPIRTDKNGFYIFTNLPPLKPGESYVTKIDQIASKDILKPYKPTATGGPEGWNSATWTTHYEDLQEAGAHYEHLDYGFTKADPPVDPKPPVIPPVKPPVKPPVDPPIPPTTPSTRPPSDGGTNRPDKDPTRVPPKTTDKISTPEIVPSEGTNESIVEPIVPYNGSNLNPVTGRSSSTGALVGFGVSTVLAGIALLFIERDKKNKKR